MKSYLKVMANLKLIVLVVFFGMLLFYLAGNAIFYQKFQFETLDIIWLLLMATVVATLKVGADYKVEKGWLNKKAAVVLLGIVIVGIMYLGNFIFGLFPIIGIQYLYFGLIMAILYIGAVSGFWIIEKFEIDSLNSCLNAFKKSI